jgi:hypothetical protein
MAERGRQPGFRMTDEHRTKIANSQILKCLVEHAEGSREMSATQVSAGLGLLRKVLPDLSSVEAKHDVSDTLADLLKAVDGRTRGIPQSG